ncbi:MAG: alpha/beta hydrolase [Proteobacteria bacterium]|nr:alpha/beta hydrolase [Pseudomonadota bacterium]
MSRSIFAAAAATTLLCLSNPVCAGAEAAQATQTEPGRFTVEVIGAGPDVILIPGLSTPRDVWRPTAEALKGQYRVHLVQIRGFGDDPGANASGPVLAPFVDELADYAARLKHPAVIGHSLGGLAAMQLAERHPGVAGKVMVVDAVPFIATLFNPDATIDTARVQAGRMRDMMLARAAASQGKPRPAPRDCSAVTGTLPPATGAMSLDAKGMCQIGNWMLEASSQVVAQAMFDDMTSDERQGIASIAVPLTVLYAVDARDPRHVGTAGTFAAAYAGAPKARLVPIADSAHFVMLDQFDKCLDAIRTFLR